MSALFEALSLRGTEFANRLWFAPMCQYSCENQDGVPGAWHLRHYATAALGGYGLIRAEAAGVLPEGRITPFCTGLWNEEQQRAWATVVDAVHHAGSKIAIQLSHSGRKGSAVRPFKAPGEKRAASGSISPTDGGWQTVAPSAIAFPGYDEPRELTDGEIAGMIEAFAAAASRAVAAGFDAIEVHAAHGYLLHQFLSPLSNVRTDSWGGSLKNRARLAVEVTRAVRAVVDVPILVRISATDWTDGGLTVEDFEQVGTWLHDAGADLIDVSSGGNVMAKIPLGPAYQTPLASQLRQALQLPVSTVGLIHSAQLAESIIHTGRADVVTVGRVALAEPNLPVLWAGELRADNGPLWPPKYERALPRK